MNNIIVNQSVGSDKIKCEIDGAMVHSIQAHIKANYAGQWDIDRYRKEFPDAPLLSDYAHSFLASKRKETTQSAENAAQGDAYITAGLESVYQESRVPMHEVFDLGTSPAAMSASGAPIPVSVFSGHAGESLNYLIEPDSDYVFNIDLLKKALIGIALNKPTLLWGYHGTGKTTLIMQVCARTRRPAIRIQHTLNMEEADVIGRWLIVKGEMQFQLGPLPLAMINGWAFIADEYDRAPPTVLSLYQSVMEGFALLIKEAPAHLRKIIPHPNFRFFATGNTNGAGDDTGLYQGTLIQDAANYSRFGITEKVDYMSAEIEENVLTSKAKIVPKNAKKFVAFANEVRNSFSRGEISTTISTRELVNAGQIGIVCSGDWRMGINLAFTNRLNPIDRELVDKYLQRIFG